MDELVHVREVVKRFGDFTAVDRVDLTVEQGEVVGLLGANGAGKTTLIRMVLGIERPTSGEVRLFGRPPGRTERARLGYVPQGMGLYDDLTVRENLAFVAEAYHSPAPALDHELQALEDRPVGSISLGFKRRVAFAAALSHHPELLILDEPTSGVGPLGRSELWDAIGGAAAADTGVLVSTHYMEEAEQCDRLVMLASGRTVAQGTTTDLTKDIRTVAITSDDWRAVIVAITEAGMKAAVTGRSVRVVEQDVDAVGEVLAEAGISAHVEPAHATFDEAFVALSDT